MDGGLFEVYFTSLIVEMASQQVAVCVRRPVGYMFNAPLGACDRRMGFMAQTLGPRTGPAGASTVSGKSAA